MPSRLKRFDQPGHTHFWTISCYRRLKFFHDDGMKQVVIDAFQHMRDEFNLCLIRIARIIRAFTPFVPEGRRENSPAFPMLGLQIDVKNQVP